ncbi:MAG TPA: SRPBCC family protein [Polyangiales bacterium]
MATKMEKAQVSLPSEREVVVTRSFKAPKALVYRAYTEPALLRRWMLGPPGWAMTVCEMATRVGDSYRWRWRNEQDGTEFGFSGVFREIEPGVRMVHTERYDAGTTNVGESGGECLVTVTFEEKAGLTTVSTSMKFDSKESRDAAVSTGMTDGMEMSYQGLDAILAESQ